WRSRRRSTSRPRSPACATRSGSRSSPATSSTCRRRRRPPCSAARAAPSSRVSRARSRGCAPSSRRSRMAELDERLRELAAGFRVLVPRPGRPDAVFVRRVGGVGEVSLVYLGRGGRVRLLVGELRGTGGADLVYKLVGPGTRIERVTVAGERGVWLVGKPHLF